MNYRFVKPLALAVGLACAGIGQASKIELTHGIDTKQFDAQRKVCDDLFGYVNATWLKANAIPADRSTWGSFEQLDEASILATHEIAEAASKDLAKLDPASIDAKVGAFYRSGDIAPERQDPVFQSYRASLVARHGEEKTKAVLARQTFNNLVYPNVSVNPLFLTLRLIQPIAVDRTVVYSSCFRMVGAPDEFFHQTVTFLSTANSPASLISTDDLETFERCQAGLGATTSEWINLQRNVHTDTLNEDGSVVANGTSELGVRAMMRSWLTHMTGAAA